MGRQRITLLDKQLEAIEAALHVAFEQEPNLQSKLELLMSVPGYGFVAAATVLAETNAFKTLQNGHEIAAYAGLAPAPNQSGLSQRRGCISKVGNARLRRIAYMAAMGAKLSQFVPNLLRVLARARQAAQSGFGSAGSQTVARRFGSSQVRPTVSSDLSQMGPSGCYLCHLTPWEQHDI